MPFSKEQFFDVFIRYNLQVWPLQIAAFGAAVIIILLFWLKPRGSGAAILGILAAMWLVNGVGYHWLNFSTINPAARVFAAGFVLQALLLSVAAFARPPMEFRLAPGTASAFGVACIAFALFFYPAFGWLAGHRYPAVPVFGIAPCPTTIFTIGVLLQGQWTRVRWLLVIPGLWGALGGSASFLLGVPQDYALFAALIGLVFVAAGHWRGRNSVRR
jgi:hypothetical protein